MAGGGAGLGLPGLPRQSGWLPGRHDDGGRGGRGAGPGGRSSGGGGQDHLAQDGCRFRFHHHRRRPPRGATPNKDHPKRERGGQRWPTSGRGRHHVHQRDIGPDLQPPQGGGPLQEHPHGLHCHPGGAEGIPSARLPGRQLPPLHGVIQSELPPPVSRTSRRVQRGGAWQHVPACRDG